jgi:hypothetical protein
LQSNKRASIKNESLQKIRIQINLFIPFHIFHFIAIRSQVLSSGRLFFYIIHVSGQKKKIKMKINLKRKKKHKQTLGKKI